MTTTKGKDRKHESKREAILREVDEAVGALALAGVETELAKDEFEKARRIEDKARRRFAKAEAKARAIMKTEKR